MLVVVVVVDVAPEPALEPLQSVLVALNILYHQKWWSAYTWQKGETGGEA